MASSSGTYKEVSCNNNSGNYNGTSSSQSMHGEWGVPTFQHQQTISMDWTPEEQALLEECLCKYASESNIIRYAKIAVQLKNKTVRDVALRCRWMTKKENSKRRKEDFNARKIKDRKEKVIDSLAKPSRLAIQSGLSHAPGMFSSCHDDNSFSYNDIGGATRQLLQQNAWAFKQISTNLATHQETAQNGAFLLDVTDVRSHSHPFQIRENICLLSQARDNIFKILANLNDMSPMTLKNMPPLPKLNEELANSILPPTPFQIQ